MWPEAFSSWVLTEFSKEVVFCHVYGEKVAGRIF